MNEFLSQEIIPIINFETNLPNYPQCDFTTSFTILLLNAPQMHIFLQKDHLKSMSSISSFLSFVLTEFQYKYPTELNDLTGFRSRSFYIEKPNNSYAILPLKTIEQLLIIKEPIFIKIISDEVWVKISMNVLIGNQSSIMTLEAKIDRILTTEKLRLLAMKIMLTAWNDSYTQKSPKLAHPKEKILLREYMKLHYVINTFNMRVFSRNDIDFEWNNREYHDHFVGIEIDIYAEMRSVEEMVFNLLQNEIGAISIEKVNMVWNDFLEIKSFDELIQAKKLKNEYRTIGAMVQNKCMYVISIYNCIVFNMGKYELVYLYYSDNKLDCAQGDYSSLLFEMVKRILVLVVSPKQVVKKKKKKKKKNIIEDNDKKRHSNISKDKEKKKEGPCCPRLSSINIIDRHNEKNNKITTTTIITKQPLCNSLKSFQEASPINPIIEPLIPKDYTSSGSSISNHNSNDNNYNSDLLNNKAFGLDNNNNSNKTPQSTTLEEINTVAKKRYKCYSDIDDEQYTEAIHQIILHKKKQHFLIKQSFCKRFINLIPEARSPSATLSLSNQIERLINEKMLLKLITTPLNSVVTMEKMSFDKYSIGSYRNFTNKIQFKDTLDQELRSRYQIQTLQRFNQELCIIFTILFLLLSMLYMALLIVFNNSEYTL